MIFVKCLPPFIKTWSFFSFGLTRYVICFCYCFCFLFLIGPVWEGGQKGEDKCLRDALYNSLVECHKRQLASLAAPAISSGIFGFPKRICAKILFSAALQFFREEPTCSIDLVRFTNFDKETVEVFLKAASNLKNEPDVRVELLSPKTWLSLLFLEKALTLLRSFDDWSKKTFRATFSTNNIAFLCL